MHSLNILSKAQINKVKDTSQKVTMHRLNSLTEALIAPNSLVRKASGVISKQFNLEHVRKRKMARHVKPQPLFLKMSLLKVDSVYA